MLVKVTVTSTVPHANQEVVVVNPMAYLWVAIKAGGGFLKYLLTRLDRTGNSADKPWRLVVYADEIVPGNPLAVSNSRKVYAMYWSFL